MYNMQLIKFLKKCINLLLFIYLTWYLCNKLYYKFNLGGVTVASIKAVEGIGQAYEAKLSEIGIKSTDDLLEKGASKKGRKTIAEESGISEKLILKWVNHVDLFRIKGIGPQYAELLEASGVDTVPELATRKPDNLLAKMISINEEKKLVKGLPALKQVEKWVLQAKELPKVVKY